MSTSERRKKLVESLKLINKEFGNNFAEFACETTDKEVIPYGIDALDKFTGGGHSCGNFTVIFGAESTGKSTLVLQAIAKAQELGKICCYIDLEHSFSKERAETLGIKMDELILIDKAKNADESLGVIRRLCKDKVVDMFVVDSIQAMSTTAEQENKGKLRNLEEKEIAELARTLSKFFKVVAPDVYNAKASVIMIGQVRIGGIGTFFTKATMTGGEAIKHWASTRIFMRRGQGADAPVEKIKEYYTDPNGKERSKTVAHKIGFDCVMKLEKTKSSKAAREGSDIHLPFYFESGFLPPKEKISIEENNNIDQEDLERSVESNTNDSTEHKAPKGKSKRKKKND